MASNPFDTGTGLSYDTGGVDPNHTPGPYTGPAHPDQLSASQLQQAQPAFDTSNKKLPYVTVNGAPYDPTTGHRLTYSGGSTNASGSKWSGIQLTDAVTGKPVTSYDMQTNSGSGWKPLAIYAAIVTGGALAPVLLGGGAGAAAGAGGSAATSAAPTVAAPGVAGSAAASAAPTVAAPGVAGATLSGAPAAGGGMSTLGTMANLGKDYLTGQGTAGKVAGLAGDVLSGMSKQSSQNAQDANAAAIEQATLNGNLNTDYQNQLIARAQLALQQNQDARAAQSDAYIKALKAALATNMQDVSVDRSQFKGDVPTISFSGGMRPSAIGPQGKAAAAALENQAMQQLLNPTQPQPLPDLQPPAPVDLNSGAGFWGNLLGAAGMTSSAIDTYNKIRNAGQPTPSLYAPIGSPSAIPGAPTTTIGRAPVPPSVLSGG